MSYLNSPRLTFVGQFQAAPSTVNNDPNHYNNATFKPNFQDYGPGTTNGWWNPDGTGNWRLVGCTITSVTYRDGTSTSNPAVDPIIGMSVMDSDSRVAGKIVDLDPQNQMVSAIWGFLVRIGPGKVDPLKGTFEVASFVNLWSRSTDLAGLGSYAASYTSVISHLEWNIGHARSRYLAELKQLDPDRLPIQFTVDRFNSDHTQPQPHSRAHRRGHWTGVCRRTEALGVADASCFPSIRVHSTMP